METLPQAPRVQRIQEIVVPRKRVRSLLMALFWLLACSFVVVLCILIAHSNASAADSPLTVIQTDWIPILLCLCFVLPGLFIANATLRFALARKPAVSITHDGIWIARTFDPFLGGGDFVAWEQIQRLALVYNGAWLFAIYPQDYATYSAGYTPWKRAVLRHEIKQSGYLSVAQVHIQTALDEIMEQIAELYAREIQRFDVELDAG